MAKRKRRKSTKCPEPLNTLIDMAGGLAMGAVASRMEQKYHYRDKGKINPYTVSAVGIASGRMKRTEDLLRTGAFLGAMGSFDIDADDAPTRPHIPEDPVFRQIREAKVNDNRYAWRLNCEDGSAYGVSPHDYETRVAYNEALKAAKGEHAEVTATSPSASVADKNDNRQYIFCRVSRLDNGANEYYLSASNNVKVGDMVQIASEAGSISGIIIAIELHTTLSAPQPPENMRWITLNHR